MNLFYAPDITEETIQYQLSDSEAHHIIKVLHMRLDTNILLFNGKGLIAQATITNIQNRKCIVEIFSKTKQKPYDYSIHIAIAPTKMNERIDYFVEKSCEIGITHISFIHTKNTIRKSIKIDRVKNIAISAIKQSQRAFLPIINDIVPFEEFINKYQGGYIAHCNDEPKESLERIFDGRSPILIGPEGDFSNEEIKLARKHAYQNITLSNYRLRTETAGICACVQAIQQIDKKFYF